MRYRVPGFREQETADMGTREKSCVGHSANKRYISYQRVAYQLSAYGLRAMDFSGDFQLSLISNY
ncbi:hypothetical protein [Moorena sp. SIO4G3]|uniref:hypothetical protein n=1 Tax=Moorena sp. SIO4G3 TaxID=2607821 RepID=UPI00142B9157|nr:hypothetical protein [Moorena sp. SIO4G3]NEO79801.1 hypothetical protein [Moorena sp. SIO4G3]